MICAPSWTFAPPCLKSLFILLIATGHCTMYMVLHLHSLPHTVQCFSWAAPCCSSSWQLINWVKQGLAGQRLSSSEALNLSWLIVSLSINHVSNLLIGFVPVFIWLSGLPKRIHQDAFVNPSRPKDSKYFLACFKHGNTNCVNGKKILVIYKIGI